MSFFVIKITKFEPSKFLNLLAYFPQWHIFSIHIVYFFGTKKTFKMVHLNFDWRFGNPRIHRIVVSQSKRGNQWFLYLVEFQNHQQNFLRNKNLKLLWLWNNSTWPLLNTSLYQLNRKLKYRTGNWYIFF